MKTPDRLKRDERGMMVFAMLGVFIILISIFAGAYFAGVRSESQEDIIELAEFKEIEREIESVEAELENLAQEAGYLAVESVKEELGSDNTLDELKNRVGERTTEIFEDNFEKRYTDVIQSGNLNLDFHLRPLMENQSDVEFIPLYLDDKRVGEEGRSEIPGFFKVKRTVHANIENPGVGILSTRKLEIEEEVKTDFFILSERMRNFDLTEVRKMVDCMISSYMNIKVYSLAFEDDIGFKESFSESFDSGWLKEYEAGASGGGEKRENVWEENTNGFLEGYRRDEGMISRDSLISEEEFIHITKLALLLEQIRTFRSYDEKLLESISDYFRTEEKTVLDLIGEGRNNKVNLQGLIISLFQEKGLLSEKMFLPELFLKRINGEDFISIVEDSEEWTETSFWMINDLVRGEIDEQKSWKYQEFESKINSADELSYENSYLRVMLSIYSSEMQEVLNSFKVDSEEVEQFVIGEIEGMEPMSWMRDVSIVGDEGTNQITKSILHRAKNLSMSFGFEEGSYDDTAAPFFYMYFLNNWGFDEKSGNRGVDQINNTGIHIGVQDKIRGEMRSRARSLKKTAETSHEEITISIEEYDEADWYEGDAEHDEVWESLNETLEPLLDLKENRLFDKQESPYITQNLKDDHDELEERIEEVETTILGLDQEAKEYTEEILEMIDEYPGKKWRSEAYDHLHEEGEGNGVQKNYLNLTDEFLTASAEELTSSYGWSLEKYELAEHIEPGKRTDQSIGYRAIGAFTQEMVREFESPTLLDHTNSRNLFKLINQNIFDLIRPREGEQKSRAMSILRGEGDPQSENLLEDYLTEVSVDFTDEAVSSSNMNDIDRWWDEVAFERSISLLETVRTELDMISDHLIDQNVCEEPYSDYADASFYRTTSNTLDALIRSMRDYREIISSQSRALGYTHSGEDGLFRTPVISAPRGQLKLYENRSLGPSSISHPLDIEVDMNHESGDMIQLQEVSDTDTRVYSGDIPNSQEWVNPFSSSYGDYYSTALSFKYFISEMEIQLSSEGGTGFVSERYSFTELNEKFEGRSYSSFNEVISPVPLSKNKYRPRSVSTPNIADASVDKNVFNGTENKAELTVEMGKNKFSNDQDIAVEVLKKRDMLTYEPRWKRKITNLYRISDEKEGAYHKTLLSRRIPSEEIDGNMINIEFDLGEMENPDGEIVLDHIVVRIRSEIELVYMNRARDLDQSIESDDYSYSSVPSFSTSEQMYLLEKKKDTHLDVFRVENRSKKEYPHNGFDLVKTFPKDSWVIRKNGFRYLVDFEEDLRYREVLSGTYRHHDPHQDDLLIDPRSELSRDASRSFPIIPENEYGYLLENEFIPLYMSSSYEDKKLYPDRMMPLEMDRVEWHSLHETFRESGYTIDIEKEKGDYLLYDVGEFNGPKKVDNSFERTKKSMREFYHDEISSSTSSITGISQEGEEMLREMQMIEDFAENGSSKRRSVFLAANFGLDRIETAEQFKVEHEDFAIGQVAKSLELIGEDNTAHLLKWLEEERGSSRNRELRAFLSFNDHFIQDLSDRTDTEDYSTALKSLDKDLEHMDFVGYKEFSIEDLSDIESFKYLQDDFKGEYVSKITAAGVTPSALEQLHVSYQIDLENFADSIEMFSDSDHFPSFVRKMNSGEYEKLASFYMVGHLEDSRVEWMPFGEDRPYLLIDDKMAFANLRPVDSSYSVEEFIDKSLKKAVAELPPGRAMVLIEVKNEPLDGFSTEEIESYIQNAVEAHDPLYRNISWVEFRIDGEIDHIYLHL